IAETTSRWFRRERQPVHVAHKTFRENRVEGSGLELSRRRRIAAASCWAARRFEMASAALEELKAQAREAKEPSISPVPSIRLGGVDPLGLRQINFDLMDQVLPGLNNVARHIRPFMVVTWAWRRAIA